MERIPLALRSSLLGAVEKELPQYEDAIAVRSDWPVLVGAINEALSFLKRNGSIERLGHQELGALTGVQLVA